MMWLLFACFTQSAWTEDRALAPHLMRMDRDANGVVGEAEYAGVLWNGPSFRVADVDGNGELSTRELAILLDSQSPTTFDGTVVEPVKASSGQPPLLSREQREVWEILVALSDEHRRVGGEPIPADVFSAAVRSGSLSSPESALVLGPVRETFKQQGWDWPNLGLP